MDPARIIGLELLVLCTGFVLHFMGFSSPWIILAQGNSTMIGLFKHCSETSCSDVNPGMPTWFQTVKALTIAASVVLTLSFIANVYVFTTLWRSHKRPQIVAICMVLFGAVAGILDFIAVGVFCQNFRDTGPFSGFAHYVCATAGGFIILGTVSIFLGLLIQYCRQPSAEVTSFTIPLHDHLVTRRTNTRCSQPQQHQQQQRQPLNIHGIQLLNGFHGNQEQFQQSAHISYC